MTFSRAFPTGATDLVSTFPATKVNTIDVNQSRGIDGTAGGTYAPSDPIIINGDGLQAAILAATIANFSGGLGVPCLALMPSSVVLTSDNNATDATGCSMVLDIGSYFMVGHLGVTFGAATDGFKFDFAESGGLVTSTPLRAAVAFNATDGDFVSVQYNATSLTGDLEWAGENGDTYSILTVFQFLVSTGGTLTLRASKATDANNDTTLLRSSGFLGFRKNI